MIVTLVDKRGNVYRTNLKKLIGYHVASSTSATVFVGTTGESATLNHDEHADIVMMTLGLADGRIPVTAGTGANATVEAISLTQRFNDSGIVGCLMATPYYNRSSQEGLCQHFKVIVEHIDLPRILYNVPPRTGYDLLPETVGRLAKVKNIIGIKEATGNSARINQIREPVSDDLVLLNGDDTSASDFMQLDGHEVTSVTVNVTAHDTAQMCKLTVEGYFAEAHVINQCLMPSHSGLLAEPNPTPVKRACKELGLVTTDTLHLPMIPITGGGRETVGTALKHAGLL